MKTSHIIALVTAGVLIPVALIATVVGVVVTRTTDSDRPEPTGEVAPAGLEVFYSQELTWSDCGGDQCASVQVPVDYSEPGGETVELAVRLIPATGPGGRKLFVNPGGPGASALDFAKDLADLVDNDLRAVYDIVGVDPRGVGESSPLVCLDDPAFDEYLADDPTPDDAAEEQEFLEGTRDLGEACESGSGNLAGHVSTVEVARDLDVVRAVLGEKKLDWFGASYGTYIGATYATLFPDQTGRMVLDGALDPTQTSFEAAMAQTTGFQRALVSFVDWCVQRQDCPLGDDPTAGIQRIESFIASLDATPIPVEDGRELTEGLGFFGVALPLYSEESWPFLSDALATAFDGSGEDLMYAADLYFERDSDGTFANNSGQVISAVNCLDSIDRPTPADLPEQIDAFTEASPLFGRFLAWGAVGCSQWPFSTAEPAPKLDGAGAPPILVLGTTRDPATPYESAVVMADELESGVLITRDGDGHTAYLSGNSCIVDTVDSFFLDGTVPAKDPRC